MKEVMLQSKAGKAIGLVDNPEEHLQRCWENGVFYEADLLEHIWTYNGGGIFMDVGSCIGNHTLFFAKFCGVQGVISIEPNDLTREHQVAVLKANDIHNVAVFGVAVGEMEGEGFLSSFGENNLGMHKLGDGGDPVVIMPLDMMMPDGDLRVLKIDVEYHEVEVLRGARQLLTRHSPAVYIEVSESQFCDVDALMVEYGYKQTGRSFCASPVYEFVKA